MRSETDYTLAMNDFLVGPKDKSKALAYYSEISLNYEGHVNRGPLRWLRFRERREMLRMARLEPNQSLLDVGCGNGFYSLMARRNGLYVESLDVNAAMLEKLRSKVDVVHVGDIETFESDRLFDRVICAGVLDFVTDPMLALSNLALLVKPGGLLILLIPRKGLGGLFYRIEKWISGFRVNLFDPIWIKQWAESFNLEWVESSHPLPTNLALSLRRR